MLASKGIRVPAGSDWTHEVKWDGMRVLADMERERRHRPATQIRLTSRTENDVTVAYPELHEIVGALGGRDVLLDGEVVALDSTGRPAFQLLAERMHVSRPRQAELRASITPVTFLIFDLLRLDGHDLMRRPLAERRELLDGLGLAGVRWQVPAGYDDGAMLLHATEEQGLEGIVSKRLDSRYHPGERSTHWLKFPHRKRASYVVGGWRYETDSDRRLGSLLVGVPTRTGLAYRGKVGSGIAGKAGPILAAMLTPLARATSPFDTEVPRADAARAHWVDPVVVIEVESLGLSHQLRLRQPSYQGVRTDLTADDIRED